MKSKFNVTGMTCSACVAHVQKAVSRVSGVTSVDVSLLTNSMFVQHTCPAQDIINAVEKAGYFASVQGEKPKQKLQQSGVTLSRLVWSLSICLLLMYVSMGHMVGLPLPSFLRGENNAVSFALMQFLLCLPVWYLNRSYFISGYKRLFSGSPNMDSLIAVGSTAGGLYGVVIIFILANAVGSGNMQVVQAYYHQLYFESSAMILALVDLGKYFENRSKAKTGDALAKLKNLAPQNAILYVDGKEQTVDSKNIQVGDVVVVKVGMVFPADGKIVYGSCFVDQSALSGESLPVEKQLDQNVTGGTTCVGGYVRVQVQSAGENSTLSKIISLVEQASTSKAPIQKLADKIASVFVPAVMAISLVTLVVWWIANGSFYKALDFAISVLVVSCPCALGLATPVALMVATGKSAQNGILVKNGEILQRLCQIKVVVLDKTGTVTLGKPYVQNYHATTNQKEFFSIIASIESQSEHPLGRAIVDYAKQQGMALVDVDSFQTVVGQGVVAQIGKDSYAIGNKLLMQNQGVSFEAFQSVYTEFSQNASTCLIVSKNGVYFGLVAVGDQIKPTSRDAIAQLKGLGIKTVLLTGDNQIVANHVAKELEIDQVFAEVLPHQKAQIVTDLKSQGMVAMVGDGINDAPALALADVGFALASGTDIAMDSADVVVVNNNVQSVATAILLGKKTITNIKQNLFWAFFYNSLGIPLAAGVLYPALGLQLSPMICALVMAFSSLFVVTNALRLRFFQPKNITQKVSQQIECNCAPKEEKMVYKMKIEGMMCSHCTGRVQKALQGVEGVTSVEIDLQGAIVEAQPSLQQQLTDAVQNQGYNVVEVKYESK